MTNIELETLASSLKIPYFRGVFMRNQLPKRIRKNESGIINLDHSSGLGTHWTAYVKRGNCIVYFDSYGNLRPPPEAVVYFMSNNDVDQIFYNRDPVQKFNAYNCGQLCLKFLYKTSFLLVQLD